MKLIGEKGLLELQRSELSERNILAESDILLNVTVEVTGYSASDQSWVVGSDWDRFLTELRRLDERRQGRAVVLGALPEDLRLEFHSTDAAGHMAVKGHVGWHRADNHFVQLRFGFSFEPDLLPSLVQELNGLRR